MCDCKVSSRQRWPQKRSPVLQVLLRMTHAKKHGRSFSTTNRPCMARCPAVCFFYLNNPCIFCMVARFFKVFHCPKSSSLVIAIRCKNAFFSLTFSFLLLAFTAGFPQKWPGPGQCFQQATSCSKCELCMHRLLNFRSNFLQSLTWTKLFSISFFFLTLFWFLQVFAG